MTFFELLARNIKNPKQEKDFKDWLDSVLGEPKFTVVKTFKEADLKNRAIDFMQWVNSFGCPYELTDDDSWTNKEDIYDRLDTEALYEYYMLPNDNSKQ